MREEIFRAYDIRGVYPSQIDESVAYRVGLAFARMLGGEGRVLVGHDVRLSSPSLASAVIGGLEEGGVEPWEAGLVPTPALYLGVVDLKFSGGIQVTASHNPPEWNGFKLVLSDGETVSAVRGMDELKQIFMGLRVEGWRPSEARRLDIVKHYIDRIKGLIRLRRRVRLVIDFSNGAGCAVGPSLLRELGCDIIPLNDSPDGRFPNHSPEPTPETLAPLPKIVVEECADFGAGLDGDADRAVFVDDRGRFLEGDLALAVLLTGMARKGRIVYDVSSSSVVEEVARMHGFTPVLARTGRAFMLSKMREVNAVIGAEKSSHLYFSEIYGFDDGIYAVARMAELASASQTSISSILDSFPRYYSSSIRAVEVPERLKQLVMEKVAVRLKRIAERVIEIDGVKAYIEDGWLLVRPSNTMPQIKYTAEARSLEGLKGLLDLAESTLGEVLRESA
jgi:phosphomannomutase